MFFYFMVPYFRVYLMYVIVFAICLIPAPGFQMIGFRHHIYSSHQYQMLQIQSPIVNQEVNAGYGHHSPFRLYVFQPFSSTFKFHQDSSKQIPRGVSMPINIDSTNNTNDVYLPEADNISNTTIGSVPMPSISQSFVPTVQHAPSVHNLIESLENQLKKELILLKNRVESVERSVISVQTSKSKNAVGNFVDSLTATTIELNPRTVEILASLSFFCIGAIIGASLLDRLWLFGGITAAWWASGKQGTITAKLYSVLYHFNTENIIHRRRLQRYTWRCFSKKSWSASDATY